jgi:hypothetical protein
LPNRFLDQKPMKSSGFREIEYFPAKAVKACDTVHHFKQRSFMKRLIPKHFLCVSTVAIALAVGGWPRIASAQTPPAPASTETLAPPTTPVVPPPNIVPGSPYAEVVRLTQAGVDQAIITTYVQNSTGLFNLDSDKIIYLSNLGAPSALVTAMMQRDQQLQQQFAANQAAQQIQPPPPAQAAQAPETTSANTTDVTPPPAPDQPVTVNYFYDTLAPYGSWVVVGGYGRCWRPTVCVYNSSWQPYCDNGHWVYSDCGWYWASDYAWGATFHYGRWFRDVSFGWCWYPDMVWAPSWVTWRYSNNYCGWAPLPPGAAYRAGVGIVYNGGNVSVGFNFGLGVNCFTFVPTADFCNRHPRNYRVAPGQLTQVYNNTTVINNYNINNRTIVNHGIAVENIAAATRTTIRPVPVHQINNPVVHNPGVQGGKSQPFNHSGPVSGANHPAYQRDFGSPLRTPGSPQSQASPPQPPHNNAVSTPPQHSAPAVGNHAPPPESHNQTPAVNQGNPNKRWQQTGTPRNATRNYPPPQSYNRPPAAAAPQPTAPSHAPASSPSPQGGNQQQGGNHNGNQNWPGH